MILPGKRFELLILLLISAAILYYIYRGKKGVLPRIRGFPAIDALREACGRAAEMGREVLYSTGLGGMHDEYAPMTIASLGILGRVAEICGELGVRLKYYSVKAYLVPVVEDIIKTGYRMAGRPELYSPDQVVYVGEEQRAYMSAVMGYILRERPATIIILGATFWETINVLGTGAIAGSMLIGGTPRLYYLPVVACICDYFLIGEELYAASAAITKDPPQMAVIGGQDIIKVGLLALLIAGLISITLGFPLLDRLIGW